MPLTFVRCSHEERCPDPTRTPPALEVLHAGDVCTVAELAADGALVEARIVEVS
jgi:hypothetical protein